MRKQTTKDINEINFESDLLTGNINRMSVTEDMSELLDMRAFAIRRVEHIFNINFLRLTESEGNNETKNSY